jgi:hypothetical protein
MGKQDRIVEDAQKAFHQLLQIRAYLKEARKKDFFNKNKDLIDALFKILDG